MEFVRSVAQAGTARNSGGWPSNDNLTAPSVRAPSIFPADAVARIFKPSRSVTTSGDARTKDWRLVFERRTAPFIEPLMGWTGGDDTLTQVELAFPTLDAAVRHAEREGLSYVVQPSSERAAKQRKDRIGAARAFSDRTLERLGLAAFHEGHGQALGSAANRNDKPGPDGWASPMAVVDDRALSLEAKRSILMDWAWTEHLIEQAINEGMPENGRPSRLDEVELALLALEGEAPRTPADRKAA
jgi:hypothetical protein